MGVGESEVNFFYHIVQCIEEIFIYEKITSHLWRKCKFLNKSHSKIILLYSSRIKTSWQNTDIWILCHCSVCPKFLKNFTWQLNLKGCTYFIGSGNGESLWRMWNISANTILLIFIKMLGDFNFQVSYDNVLMNSIKTIIITTEDRIYDIT